MNKTCVYSPGTLLYIMYDNKIIRDEVTSALVCKSTIDYTFSGITRSSSEVFETKEELIKSL